MGQAAPPVGYELLGGTWGTDADQDSDADPKVGGAARYNTGNASVWFDDSAAGGNIYLQTLVSVPCTAGDLLNVSGWANGDTNAVTDAFLLGITWMDETDSFVSYSWVVVGTPVTTVDTWEFKQGVVTAPAGAYGWRLLFGKAKSNVGFNAWWDSVFVEAVRPAFFAYLSANQSCATNAQIEITGELYDYGSVFDNSSTNWSFTAPANGVYSLCAGFQIQDLPDGAYGRLYFKLNGSAWLSSGQAYSAIANGDPGGTVVAPAVYLSKGDVVKLYVAHDAGGSKNVVGGSGPYFTYFSGALLY